MATDIVLGEMSSTLAAIAQHADKSRAMANGIYTNLLQWLVVSPGVSQFVLEHASMFLDDIIVDLRHALLRHHLILNVKIITRPFVAGRLLTAVRVTLQQ
jgi:hypothetical protein